MYLEKAQLYVDVFQLHHKILNKYKMTYLILGSITFLLNSSSFQNEIGIECWLYDMISQTWYSNVPLRFFTFSHFIVFTLLLVLDVSWIYAFRKRLYSVTCLVEYANSSKCMCRYWWQNNYILSFLVYVLNLICECQGNTFEREEVVSTWCRSQRLNKT